MRETSAADLEFARKVCTRGAEAKSSLAPAMTAGTMSRPQIWACGKKSCHTCRLCPWASPISVMFRALLRIGSKSAEYRSTYLWSSCDLSVPCGSVVGVLSCVRRAR